MKKAIIIALLTACLASTGLADEAARVQTARQIVKDYGESLVWISAVSKSEMGSMLGGSGEQEIEVVGTVIDPSGLTVVSNTALDPFGALGMMLNIGGQSINTKSTLSDVKITLADGTEIDAKLVLKDPDLDLAFVMPEKTDGEELPKFKHVPLDKGATAEMLDPMIELSRLGKSLDRQCSVQLSRISAVVKKPRTFYCGGAGMGGTPAFTETGKVLGIASIRKPKTGGMMAMGAMQPVILPAEDVLEIAEQAKAVGADKKENSKETDKEADDKD